MHSKSIKCGNQESTNINQLILSLDKILCSKMLQNSKIFTWNSDFLFKVHHPWSHKTQPGHFYIFCLASPKKSDYSDITLCPTALFSQNSSLRTSTSIPPPPCSQNHLYFLSFRLKFTSSSQNSSWIASLRVFLTPKPHKQGQEN